MSLEDQRSRQEAEIANVAEITNEAQITINEAQITTNEAQIAIEARIDNDTISDETTENRDVENLEPLNGVSTINMEDSDIEIQIQPVNPENPENSETMEDSDIAIEMQPLSPTTQSSNSSPPTMQRKE